MSRSISSIEILFSSRIDGHETAENSPVVLEILGIVHQQQHPSEISQCIFKFQMSNLWSVIQCQAKLLVAFEEMLDAEQRAVEACDQFRCSNIGQSNRRETGGGNDRGKEEGRCADQESRNQNGNTSDRRRRATTIGKRSIEKAMRSETRFLRLLCSSAGHCDLCVDENSR